MESKVLIKTPEQLIANLISVENYLVDTSSDDCQLMLGLIARGVVFVHYYVDGVCHFAPSRFVGYINNILEQHKINQGHGSLCFFCRRFRFMLCNYAQL